MQTHIRKASLGGSFLLGVAAFIISGLLAWAWLHFSASTESYDEVRSKLRAAKLEELKRENEKVLGAYGWANKEKGIVRLPVSRGMELVLNDLKAKSVHPSSVQVESPYPAGLQPAPAIAPVVSSAPAPETK